MLSSLVLQVEGARSVQLMMPRLGPTVFELGLSEASSGPSALTRARYPHGGDPFGIPSSVAPECLGDSKSRAGTLSRYSCGCVSPFGFHVVDIRLESELKPEE